VTDGRTGRVTVLGGPEPVTLRLSGEFDLANVAEVESVAGAAIDSGARHVCLDLDDVTFMDSSMLNLMVNLRKRLISRRGDLSVQPNMQVQKLLEISGLGGLFDLAGD
jgi:anti-anti-sigma factor